MKKSEFSLQQKTSVIAIASILSALSILLGKYLAINLGQAIRISFENFPILLAGFCFGPWIGAAVGTVADLVGCFLVGYSINPIITLGAALIGFLAGIGKRLSVPNKTGKIFAVVFLSHLIASVLVKTFGLCLFYQMPFLATLAWRGLTYFLVFLPESAILSALLNNRVFMAQIKNVQSS